MTHQNDSCAVVAHWLGTPSAIASVAEEFKTELTRFSSKEAAEQYADKLQSHLIPDSVMRYEVESICSVSSI